MSADSSTDGWWLTPPPESSDGSDVWSSEVYSTAIEVDSVFPRHSLSAPYAGAGGYAGYLAQHPAPNQPLPPYWPKPGEVYRPVDGFAITAFVFGLLGGVLFALAFGVASLRRIGRGERRGKGFAVAAIVLSILWIGGAAAYLVYRART